MGNAQKNNDSISCPLGKPECTIEEKIASLSNEIDTLKKQVITDALTGLFNVSHMRFVISQEMERTRRQFQPTTFILLDVDHFKKFNDTYGHIVGDKVLKHLAEIIKSTVRQIDVACRYGGEEFGIILPSSPLLVGAQVAERLRQKVSSTPLVNDGEELSITVSAGVGAFSNRQNESVDSFIAHVDKQLYQAKENGRDQVHYTTEKMASKGEVSQSEKDALFNQLNDENK